MANQLIPEPALMPPAPDHLTLDERAALWVDLVDTADKLLLAGLRREVGPTGDLVAARRACYKKLVAERDGYWQQFAERLHRVGVSNGG